MPLKRTEHWATREFDKFLRHEAHAPFVWGQHDCCLFAANAIQAFTGTDLAADFRGKYHDEASAFALIKTVTGGGTTVEDAAAWCAQKHGLVEWVRNGVPAPLFAQRGDLVVMEESGRLLAGVMHLRGTHAVTVGEGGLVKVSIRNVKRAWKI